MLPDTELRAAAAELYYPGMGTENVARLLYSLVRMLKPRSCLEVGLGYTTPFLALALVENDEEIRGDVALYRPGLSAEQAERRATLSDNFFAAADSFSSRLHAVDSFVLDDFSDQRTMRVLERIGAAHKVQVIRTDFRAALRELAPVWLPLDFVWFDCGGLPDAIDFINTYWPCINPHHGTLLLHYTYFKYSVAEPDGEHYEMLANPLVNELKKRQTEPGAAFEVISLLEPNKIHQSSVTMLRKLPWSSRVREGSLVGEAEQLFGLSVPALVPFA